MRILLIRYYYAARRLDRWLGSREGKKFSGNLLVGCLTGYLCLKYLSHTVLVGEVVHKFYELKLHRANVDIPDDLLQIADRRAIQRRKGIGCVINDLASTAVVYGLSYGVVRVLGQTVLRYSSLPIRAMAYLSVCVMGIGLYIILRDGSRTFHDLQSDRDAASMGEDINERMQNESIALGFGACAISSVLFGSMFVPIKPFDTGDGMFVQWVMGSAIFVVGLIVNLMKGCPPFYPLAMVGGFLWATANVTAVPIVNTIGMALGILIWNSTNLLAGWASGRFGWFNTKPQVPESDFMNYLGLAFAIISTVMFAFVKNRPTSVNGNGTSKSPPFLAREGTEPLITSSESSEDTTRESLSGYNSKRVIAIVVSLIAGVFYGLCFAPIIYIQDNYDHASKEGPPYIFAQFCGIFLTSTFYMICYSAYKQNLPKVNPRTVLPAFLAGILWAVAQSSWFVANSHLSEAVSFPIITRFPGIVAALWGVFYFHEIRVCKALSPCFYILYRSFPCYNRKMPFWKKNVGAEQCTQVL